MKRIVAAALTAMLMFSAFAAVAQQAATSGNSKGRGKNPAKSGGPSVSEQLKTMQDSIQAQQQQIHQLMQQLQSRDGQIQQLQQQINEVQSTASQAQQKADSANSVTTQQQTDVAAVKNDISDLKSSAAMRSMTRSCRSFGSRPDSWTKR